MPIVAKKSKSRAKRPKHRASWTGNLSFGLVTFPVQAFNARSTEQGDIHFHQLHAQCHRRIRYQKLCPKHGPVSQDEIVSGYEYRKGKYVEIEAEEMDALRTQAERSLTIDAFVDPGEIDPIYFDGRMYYLAPAAESAAEPYAVFAAALAREERYGVGQVVFSGKDQLALVRPLEGVLHMAMLNFDEEIRRPGDVVAAAKPAGGKRSGSGRMLHLAQNLIRTWSDHDFDFADYDDRYREKVRDLIEAKLRGRVIEAPEEAPPEVINLMDALKQSLARGRGAASGARKRTRKRRPA